MEDKYIKIEGLPEWFEWNTQTLEGRTFDRIVMRSNGRPQKIKGIDPMPWYTSKSDQRPHIQLTVNGKLIALHKHQLIWMAHHMRPIPKGYEIHHIDGDWTNNSIDNLQLLTEEEHRKLHAEELSKAVVALDEKGNVVHRFASTHEAERNGFDQGAVSKACRGVYYDCKSDPHRYKGLYWYYEEEWLRLLQS